MKILVCVKQVLDPDGPIRIAASGRTLEAAPDGLFRMNRFDEFALEAALQIREEFPGTRIDALTAGPARAARTVRRALETGADEGIHLLLEDDGCRTPFETASIIGAAARDRRYDLILTGVMAEDDMQAQVGPMLAEILSYPWATAVMALQVTPPPESSSGPGVIRVERELEGGRREAFALTLPALLTIQSGANRPRYPALSHVLRARSQALETIPLSRLYESGAGFAPPVRERLLGLEEPAPLQTGLILAGSPEEKAEALLRILRTRGSGLDF